MTNPTPDGDNPRIIAAAVELLHSARRDLPVEVAADRLDFGQADTRRLREMLEEVTHADLLAAVEAAASRLDNGTAQ
jgi:hypothetical protein